MYFLSHLYISLFHSFFCSFLSVFSFSCIVSIFCIFFPDSFLFSHSSRFLSHLHVSLLFFSFLFFYYYYFLCLLISSYISCLLISILSQCSYLSPSFLLLPVLIILTCVFLTSTSYEEKGKKRGGRGTT